jgi:hypothetical protein
MEDAPAFQVGFVIMSEAWMNESKAKRYIGMAGHLAVMAELARRGYNVAIPEIDVGDDIFVLNDETRDFKRIQVKTSNSPQINERNRRCSFNIGWEKLNREDDDTIYVLCALIGTRLETTAGVRRGTRYRFLILEQEQLVKIAIRQSGKIRQKGTFKLTAHFGRVGREKIIVSTGRSGNGIDLTKHLNNWRGFPKLYG